MNRVTKVTLGAVAVTAVLVVTAFTAFSEDPGVKRIEQRQTCDSDSGLFGSMVATIKRDDKKAGTVTPASQFPLMFPKLVSPIMLKFYDPLYREVDETGDRADAQAKRMCYEYFGVK